MENRSIIDVRAMALDRIIGTGLLLLGDTDNYDAFAEWIDEHIRYEYEDNGAIYFEKDMCRILRTTFKTLLIETTYDTSISINDKEKILDAILLLHEYVIK